MDPVVLADAENSPLPGVVARAGGEDCVVLCDTQAVTQLTLKIGLLFE